MDNNNNTGCEIGFSSILFFIFLVLKLCGIIEWSWWWVTAPLWMTVGFVVIAILFLVLLKILSSLFG